MALFGLIKKKKPAIGNPIVMPSEVRSVPSGTTVTVATGSVTAPKTTTVTVNRGVSSNSGGGSSSSSGEQSTSAQTTSSTPSTSVTASGTPSAQTTSSARTQESLRNQITNQTNTQPLGNVLLTAEEAKKFNIQRNTIEVPQTIIPTIEERAIEFGEEFSGQKKGSSGMVFAKVGEELKQDKIFSPIVRMGGKIVSAFDTANKNMSEGLVKPLTPELPSTKEFVGAMNALPTNKLNNPFTTWTNKGAQTASYSLARGFYNDVREKPVTAIVTYYGGKFVGAGYRAVKEGFHYGKELLGYVPKATKVISRGSKMVGASKTILGGAIGTTTVGATVYTTTKSSRTPNDFFEKMGAQTGRILLFGAGFSSGYNNALRPISKTVNIPPPKPTVYTRGTIGTDLNINKGDKQINKVWFDKQKISQEGTAGARTIWTTKERELLGMKNLYGGVPYQDKKGYASTFNKLVRYGYTPSQASGAMRYTTPIVRSFTLQGGSMRANGKIWEGNTRFLQKNDIIVVDKELGIKTRGGGQIRIVDAFARVPTGKNTFAGTYQTEYSKVNLKGESKWFRTDIGTETGQGKVTKLKKGFYPNVQDNVKSFEAGEYQNLFSNTGRQNFLSVTYGTKMNRVDTTLYLDKNSKTILFKKEIKIDENIGIKGGKKKSSAEFFENLYKENPKTITTLTQNQIILTQNQIIKDVSIPNPIVSPTKTSVINVPPTQTQGITASSVWAGTGQYERTEGGMLQQQGNILNYKTMQLPTMNNKNILDTKDILIVKEIGIIKTKTHGGTRIIQEPMLDVKTIQKEVIIQKTIPKLKTMQLLKSMQVTKQMQQLKTKQMQQLKTKQIVKNILKTPMKKLPKIPSFPKVSSGYGKRNSFDSFEAFITKGGKDYSLGKKETQMGAELLLKGKLIGGLSASGFIKKGESKLKASELKSFGSGEFRLSKANEFKVVEKKEKRLRKSTTGKEIQIFRKNKRKSGGLFGL